MACSFAFAELVVFILFSGSAGFSMNWRRARFPQKFRGFGPEHSLLLVCRIHRRARNALLEEVHSFVFFSTLPMGHGQKEKVKWLCLLFHLNRAVERGNRVVPMVVAVLGQTEGGPDRPQVPTPDRSWN